MLAYLILLALPLVSWYQITSIRSVLLHPVPVTSTRFLLLRAGWALLLGCCCWLLLGPGFQQWIQTRSGLLVVLGVALLSFVEHISRHLLYAYSQQWNERLVWGMCLAAVVGFVANVGATETAFTGWLLLLRGAAIVLVLGTLYQRTKRHADRARWLESTQL